MPITAADIQDVHIDGREMSEIRILCRCATCGQEYIMVLKHRQECGPCGLKWLYPPDGIKPAERAAQRREERRNLRGWRWLKHFLGFAVEKRDGKD